MAAPSKGRTKGTVTEVLGNVVDIEFPPEDLPAIYNAIEIPMDGQELPLSEAHAQEM